MSRRTLIIGQGLAGSVLAWQAAWRGDDLLVADVGTAGTASAAAAGLVMPISGQRMAGRPDYPQLFTAAAACYRRIEQLTGRTLFHSRVIERRFLSAVEREQWDQRLQSSASGTAAESMSGCQLLPSSGRFGSLRMPGWQLNVPLLLQVTREYLLAAHQFHQRQIDPAEVVVQDGCVRVADGELEAERLFFCEGHRGRSNCWFPGQPDQPVRGELLRVRLNQPLSADVVVGRVWAAPVPGAQDSAEYIVGATWDREQLDEGLVTAAGRAELLQGLTDLGDGQLQVEVLGQTSGIRAGTRQRRVLVRLHAEHPQLGMLNGLGSWGSLTAPASATALLDLQEESARAGGDVSAAREQLISMGAGQLRQHQAPFRSARLSLTKLAHSTARRAFRAGDRVLDATAGNGHDTQFLAGLAGAAAVTAIDLQPAAIAATRRRLAEAADQVTLIVGDHAEELERCCQEALVAGEPGAAAEVRREYGVIMFNLGYLPGSDRRVITQPETTRRALTAGLLLLRPRGVLTAIVYRGHPGSAAEYAAVQQVAAACDRVRVDVVPGDASDETSPVLFVFRAPAVINS